MRFIRDIIREKQSDSATRAEIESVDARAVDDLDLETPDMLPEEPEQSASAEPLETLENETAADVLVLGASHSVPSDDDPASELDEMEADEIPPFIPLQQDAGSDSAPDPSLTSEPDELDDPVGESVTAQAPWDFTDKTSQDFQPADDDAEGESEDEEPDLELAELEEKEPTEDFRIDQGLENVFAEQAAERSARPVSERPTTRVVPDVLTDMAEPEDTDTSEEMLVASPEPEHFEVPAPSAGRASRRAGRVKTRLLGFNNNQGTIDPFENGTSSATPQPFASAAQVQFPVGWLVVVNGPGTGTGFTLFNGVAQIGRSKSQTVSLDFGDNSISRENHAAVAYDPEAGKFYLGHGGKANLVRLNDRPVLSTEELQTGSLIRIGETTLRFVAFCSEDFTWGTQPDGGVPHAVGA